ncbi:MAG: HAD-IIB family hydrolase [Planctomycetes bacterium]|nr:HAD-IIB family hydrolase [Planctomycetota bacterium]
MPESVSPASGSLASTRSIDELPHEVCRSLAALLCDLDDTLTSCGKLSPAAYSALWKAREAGLPVVVVTGRPAGWADHIARLWPVHGVIGENGGLYFRLQERRMIRHFAYPEADRALFHKRLEKIAEEIREAVPGCRVAADQPYREFDLAIDHAEDVAPLNCRDILRIRQIFLDHGARAKISSIHVNGWFGSFDKLQTSKLYLEREMSVEASSAPDRVIHVGDSPNDDPLFRCFRHSIGVAGIRRWASLVEHPPAYITNLDGGEGFAEAVDAILSRRRDGEAS